MENTASELAALRKEVAELKQQLAELKQFLYVQSPTNSPDKKHLHIRCSGLTLNDPSDPMKCRGGFEVEPDGPVLYLWGDDNTARVLLEAKNNKPALRLYNDGLKMAVNAGLDKNQHGFVAVYDHGKPRAAMRAHTAGGCVQASHDDGMTRAAITATEESGNVGVFNKDLKATAVLESEFGPMGGGAVLVRDVAGKESVVVCSSPVAGFVAVHDSDGKMIASLPGKPGEEEE
jgi:hypothetical protein